MTVKDRDAEGLSHDQIRLLLPWYVNRSLEAGEKEQVDAHLDICARCRAELEELRVFAESVAAPPRPRRSQRAAYARLLRAIGRRRAQVQGTSGVFTPGRRSGRTSLFARSSWAAILIGLVLSLGLYQAYHWMDPRFRTLAENRPETRELEGDLRVGFDEALGPDRVEALLRSLGATRVAGPDGSGLYTLRLAEPRRSAAAVEAAIAEFRHRPEVIFAEPVRRP